MRLIVIYNAEAGAGHMSREELERLLGGAGHQLEIVDRKDAHWQRRLAGADAVVVAGGDGTVQKVIHGAAGSGIPVAILPTGTANNIAHSLGFTVGDQLGHRIADWSANEKRIGLGSAARGEWGTRFIESVGVGAFADMVSDSEDGPSVDHPAVSLARVRAALIERLLDAAPVAIEFAIDGKKIAGEFLLAEVLNMRFVGPRMQLAPDQSSERGMLTVCAIHASQREVAAHWIGAGTGDPRRFQLGRGRVVRMCTAEQIHVDGKGVESPTGDVQLEASASDVRIWV